MGKRHLPPCSGQGQVSGRTGLVSHSGAVGCQGDAPAAARTPSAPGALWGSPCVAGLYPSTNKQFIALEELSWLALGLAVTQTLFLVGSV